jgi:hypothetical protein
MGSDIFEKVKDKIDFDTYFSEKLTYSLPWIQLSEIPLEEIGEIKKKAPEKILYARENFEDSENDT